MTTFKKHVTQDP